MTVIKHEEFGSEEMGFFVERIGGSLDGERFRVVKAEMSEGPVLALWVSNHRPGYFRQVFVPWDWQHKDAVG